MFKVKLPILTRILKEINLERILQLAWRFLTIVQGIVLLLLSVQLPIETQATYFMLVSLGLLIYFFELSRSQSYLFCLPNLISDSDVISLRLDKVSDQIIAAFEDQNYFGYYSSLLAFPVLVLTAIAVFFVSGYEINYIYIVLYFFGISIQNFVNQRLGFYEGLGLIKEVYSLRLVQLVIAFLTLIICFTSIGFNLSIFIVSIILPNLILLIILVHITYAVALVKKVSIDTWLFSFNKLRRDLIKTAVVGFAFQSILIPSVSMVISPSNLVRFATGLQLANSIYNTANILLQTRVPMIISYAKESLTKAKKQLIDAIGFSFAFALFSTVLLLLVVLNLEKMGLNMFIDRFPVGFDLVWFGVYIMSQLLINILAYIMRIVRLERMFKVTLVVGISFISSVFMSSVFGSVNPSLVLALVYAFIGMPVTIYYYIQARKASMVWL